jgi:hypothetical protein
MEPELKILEHKTNLIIQAIKNKTITVDILNDYMTVFRALNVELRQKLVSLDNKHLDHIYTDDDIELLELELKI